MEARTDIAAGRAEHHLSDLGFDDQGFGPALMIDDDLRIEYGPMLFVAGQPDEEEVDLATADIGAVVLTGNVEHIMVGRGEKTPLTPNGLKNAKKVCGPRVVFPEPRAA